MPYSIKEIFYTLQGEGMHAGTPAVFCRFAGCNLWTGRDEDRASATCAFCDTDFVGTDGPGGGTFASPEDVVRAVAACWPHTSETTPPFVVCTGGEPLLQLDTNLIEALHSAAMRVAVETNGTLPAPPGLDWICVSPKAGAAVRLTAGDELKLVFPQEGMSPSPMNALTFDISCFNPWTGRHAR